MEFVWNREKGTCTLEGEPVLTWQLSLPGGKGKLGRFYSRVARQWKGRWQREVYWRACLELVHCREQSRPFRPWTARLEGEVTLQREDLLSLRLEGEEQRGDAGNCRVCWGDVWRLPEEVPVPPGTLFGTRGWKKQLLEELVRQGENRRRAGDFFPDRDWEGKLEKAVDFRDLWLTEEGVALALPQGAVASMAEGTPIFAVPLQKI